MIFFIKPFILFTAIIAITNAVEFNCRYDSLVWPIIGSQYACYASVANAGNGEVLTNVCAQKKRGCSNILHDE